MRVRLIFVFIVCAVMFFHQVDFVETAAYTTAKFAESGNHSSSPQMEKYPIQQLGLGTLSKIEWAGDELDVYTSTNIWHYSNPMISTAPENRFEGMYDRPLALIQNEQGERLISDRGNGWVTIHNVSSNDPPIQFRAHTGPIDLVDFTVDGSMMAVQRAFMLWGSSEDNRVRIWDLDRQERLATPPYEIYTAYSYDLSPDGIWLASTQSGMKINIWRVGSGVQVTELDGRGPVRFASDNRTLAFTSIDEKVTLFDVEVNRVLAVLPTSRRVSAVNFDATGQRIAVGFDDGRLELWQTDGSEPPTALVGHTGSIVDVSFNADGSVLASGSEDGTVRLWNVEMGELINALEGFTLSVDNVVFHPSDEMVISSDGTVGEPVIRFWDISTGIQQDIIHVEDQLLVEDIVVAPNREWLIAAYYDNYQVWNLATGELIRDYVFSGEIGAHSTQNIAINQDETLLAIDDHSSIHIHNLETSTELFELEGQKDGIRDLAFHPDGQTLISSSGTPEGDVVYIHDYTVRIWDIDEGELIFTLPEEESAIFSIAISPDGTLLAYGTYDGEITFWNLVSQELVMTFSGHESVVEDLLFMDDGSTLISGSRDRTIRLWDVKSGEELAVLRGHTGSVLDLALNSDSTVLASSSRDGTVRLWRIP